ncbi:GD18978 [Drosophila simulans]|uniref:GD18978 n=1 Tax=Drosophila simulans TaxID=7240 RepID=B4QZ80_DROSI|nr:GD18978 [Drosophila simulans]
MERLSGPWSAKSMDSQQMRGGKCLRKLQLLLELLMPHSPCLELNPLLPQSSSNELLSWTVTDGLGAPLFSASNDYDDDEDGDDRAALPALSS